MKDLHEFEAALRLSRMKGVGAAGFKQLMLKYKLPSKALIAWLSSEKQAGGLSLKSQKKNSNDEMIESTIRALCNEDYYGYYFSQEGYPQQLGILGEPPPVIYSTSRMKPFKYAAVVGSRNTSKEEVDLAKRKTLELIESGYSIISGGAGGIDSIALKTAVEANAYTVAILANGLDVVYPKANAELFWLIRNNGTLMTELMFGAKAHKSFFPTRNRLIAAMADIVIALPSSEKSGSLITANWARKLGKKVEIFF